jgi:D-glycero-D-manno-heptose 1,7-bisphosphate phosphatase
MRRAIFLDRDGVLNRVYLQADGKTHPPKTLDQLEILPGVPEACRSLRRAGFLLIVVSNQPDVARGTQRREVVEAINQTLRLHISLDEVRICCHDNQDNCFCRKPKPGLLLDAARDWGINTAQSFMIGDRWTDIEAGRRAGCQTVLVNASYREWARSRPHFYAGSLLDAAGWILNQDKGHIPPSRHEKLPIFT